MIAGLGPAGAVRAQLQVVDPNDLSDPAARALQMSEPGDEVFSREVPAAVQARIRESIRGLASPSYQARVQSTDQLIGMGAVTFPLLRETYRDTDDLEVQQRIEIVVFEAFINYMVPLNDWGYLGIQGPIQTNIRTHEHDARIPRGKIGLPPTQVMPDTPAERGGLIAGDVIIAMDGEYLEGGPVNGFSLFASAIRRRGPGTPVKLTVLRENETLELSVVLGRPPVEQLNQASGLRIQGLNEAYSGARQRFGPWWQKYFADTRPSALGADE
ncbi:MAG: PDZ domain-containing protein [Phycisphaerae bacterium]|nr:PDZ domain-containing protein [Phycisphaerae bacterium]